MSVVPAWIHIYRHDGVAAKWRPCSSLDTVAGAAVQITSPSDDELMIRFMFYKETLHSLSGVVEENWIIPQSPTEVIVVRPSEFCNQDAETIDETPSGRMIIDFIDAHFPPRDSQPFRDDVVRNIVRLVQGSIGSENKGFVDVQRYHTLDVRRYLKDDDEASTKVYFVDTKSGTCAICLEDYEIRRDDGIRLPCLHVFHGSCISKWLVDHSRCPVCCSFPFGAPASVASGKPAEWFNPPVQDGIWMSHSSICDVRQMPDQINRYTGQVACVEPMGYVADHGKMSVFDALELECEMRGKMEAFHIRGFMKLLKAKCSPSTRNL